MRNIKFIISVSLILSVQPLVSFATCANSLFKFYLSNQYPGEVALVLQNTNGTSFPYSDYSPPRVLSPSTNPPPPPGAVVIIENTQDNSCGSATLTYETPQTIGHIPGCKFYFEIVAGNDYKATATALNSESSCEVQSYSDGVNSGPIFIINKK